MDDHRSLLLDELERVIARKRRIARINQVYIALGGMEILFVFASCALFLSYIIPWLLAGHPVYPRTNMYRASTAESPWTIPSRVFRIRTK
jgi:hypothetical protein